MTWLRPPLMHHFFLAPPGQQTGQGPEPRYLCPRLQVFQPLLLLEAAVFFEVAKIVSRLESPEILCSAA